MGGFVTTKETVLPSSVKLIRGDCYREIRKLRGRIDAVVTDPPYGIGAPDMTLGAGKKEFKRGEWDQERPDIEPFISLAPLTCIWGGNYFTDILPVTNDWLIWHKRNDGRSYSECEMAWTNFGKNVRHLSHHWATEKKKHPTQKPTWVMRWCLSFLPEGCTVLDPFMGSGTTGVACVMSGRNFIGIEIDPDYFKIAERRIAGAPRRSR